MDNLDPSEHLDLGDTANRTAHCKRLIVYGQPNQFFNEQLEKLRESYPDIEVVFSEEVSEWPRKRDPDVVWFDEVGDPTTWMAKEEPAFAFYQSPYIPEQEYRRMGSNQRIGGRIGNAALAMLAAGAGEVPRMQRFDNHGPSGMAIRSLRSMRTFKGTTGVFWEPGKQGAKERKKGALYYMEHYFPNGTLRSAPVMQKLRAEHHAKVVQLMRDVRVMETAQGYDPVDDEKLKSMAVYDVIRPVKYA